MSAMLVSRKWKAFSRGERLCIQTKAEHARRKVLDSWGPAGRKQNGQLVVNKIK